MRKTAAAVLAAALLVGFAPGAQATPDTVQKGLDGLTTQQKFPAALATVTTGNRSSEYVAGTAELGRKVKVPKNGQVRIGSNTKAFVAVVVMQLVAEGKVGLDDRVTKHLPGLIKDDRITVRQLLQHTSGLANYTNHMGLDKKFSELRHRYAEPRELLDIANAHPPSFQPGEKWEYSNTNYVLLGLLVQKITGRPIAEQVKERVIDKANLRDTYWPAQGEQGIRGKHAHGYSKIDEDPRPQDVTELDPSWGWAAGQLIGTNRDLNLFYQALMAGKLVPRPQLDEMKKTVPAFPGTEYGLGIMSRNLTCGGKYWGHGGDIHGYETRGGVAENGKAYSVAVTALPGTFQNTDEEAMAAAKAVEDTVDAALCKN